MADINLNDAANIITSIADTDLVVVMVGGVAKRITKANLLAVTASTIPLTFAIAATGITHTGSDFIGNGSGYGDQHALGDHKLPASIDGYIQADLGGSINESAIIAFQLIANDNPYSNYQYGVFAYSGTYYKVQDGTVTSLSVSSATGDKYRLIRASGVVKAQYYRSSAWVDLYTFPALSGGNAGKDNLDLFINLNIGATGNKVSNPAGFGVIGR